MITAPYNFVPLNEKVFFPPWAEDVSHDIPFEDGESGEIDITITAKSPIFVRDHQNPKEFCQHNGQYYIPGSSVKGMVRNVLEIMSFSKMSFIDDKTYSVRDLKYKKYMDRAKNVLCGWLFYDEGGKLKIEDCGEPYRIKYDEIERKFRGEFQKSKFMDGIFINANSPYKKAYEKYNLINEDIFQNFYNFSSHRTDGSERKIVTFEESSLNLGKLVLTGHPSARREPNNGRASGKIYDFVFMQKETSNILDVSKEVFDNFKFAYFDKRTTQPKESEDWEFWKERLNMGDRVPVFFHKNFSSVSSFGLSYLYKFPYTKSIMQALIENHGSDEIDLAESIFGFSRKVEDEQISRKGRVQFSHAKKMCNTQSLDSRYVLLGTPKASYYPIYLVQNGGEYKTLMDSNSILAGWKRYPVHKDFNHRCHGESTQTTKMTPLNQNSRFKLKVRFHNLKKVEIGALLSALTFHGDSDKYFHSLGLAKSYGYGKVSLGITKTSSLKYSQEEYIKAFESAVNFEVFDSESKWHESEQIKNLFTMAKPQDDSNLKYMELKKFASEKNKNEDGSYNYLDRYINLDGVSSQQANSYSEIKTIEEYQKSTKQIREVYLENKAQKEQLKKEKDDWEKAKASNTVQSLEKFINSIYTKEALELISNIKLEEEKVKHQENQKKAEEKWDAIQKVDKKYFKDALKKFILDYPNSSHIKEAKMRLEELSTKNNFENKDDLSGLETKKDFKGFRKIILDYKDLKKLDSKDKEQIKKALIIFYNNTSKKNQKKFIKEFDLSSLVDKKLEDEIKKELGL